MTMRRLLLALMLACLSSLALAQGQPPVASLDRTTAGAGETVTLNIEIGDGDDDAPDLSPLTPDFV
ncbi:MAG: protein BatD, partial [Luteibacter sp.]